MNPTLLSMTDYEITSDNTMSLISLDIEHWSSSVNNTNNKASDFTITESSVPAVIVSSIEVLHNENNSIFSVIAKNV